MRRHGGVFFLGGVFLLVGALRFAAIGQAAEPTGHGAEPTPTEIGQEAIPTPPSAAATAGPCQAPAYRAFDFWIGDWLVHTPDGRLAGVNRIAPEYGGCVLHERYDTGAGYRGESLNTYDPGRGVWHQTWVDSSGTLLLLEGGLRGESMVMEGQTTGADAKVTRHRITWTPHDDGSVRQLWESTNAQGEWAIAFDGKYTRNASP